MFIENDLKTVSGVGFQGLGEEQRNNGEVARGRWRAPVLISEQFVKHKDDFASWQQKAHLK